MSEAPKTDPEHEGEDAFDAVMGMVAEMEAEEAFADEDAMWQVLEATDGR